MSNGTYRFLDHTADLRVTAVGRSFAEVATALLRALGEIVYGPGLPASRPVATVPVRPGTDDPPLALVEILNEALYRMEIERLLPVAFEGDSGGGTIRFVPVPEDAEPVREVKAATYSGARCERLDGGAWIAEVTFDL